MYQKYHRSQVKHNFEIQHTLFSIRSMIRIVGSVPNREVTVTVTVNVVVDARDAT